MLLATQPPDHLAQNCTGLGFNEEIKNIRTDSNN